MKLEGQTGPQVDGDGSVSTIRQGRMGAVDITQLHGKYAEQAVRGNVYTAMTAVAGGVLSGPAAASCVPLALFNPPGSGKNLYLIRTQLLPTTTNVTAFATGAFAYYGVINPILSSVTLGTINCTLLGSNVTPRSVATVYTAGTLAAAPAAVLIAPFATKFGAAAVAKSTGLPERIVDEVDGQIGLSPGGLLLLQQTAADGTNLTAILSFVWEEVPV